MLANEVSIPSCGHTCTWKQLLGGTNCWPPDMGPSHSEGSAFPLAGDAHPDPGAPATMGDG